MTNYDRWKLATPDYLEDTNEEEPLHDTDADDEDGEDPCGSGKSDAAHGEGQVS
jgi:hypothetical protein